MYTIKERLTTNNEESNSRCKNYIGILIIDKDNKLCSGEKKLPDGTVVRFVNGLIDGNDYDANGEIISSRAAVEYSFGGQEFWTKGFPKGFPAVSQNLGIYEEDWDDGHIISIREEIEVQDIQIFEP